MFLFLIDSLMARNSCCISAVITKSVLMWGFLCLPEQAESLVLIANLCQSSKVAFLLPSSQLHHGTQANVPLNTSKPVNISVVD